jgi:cell division protein FtsL
MKKGSKPFLLFIITTVVVLFFLILVYVSLRIECQRLTKVKYDAEKTLEAKKNQNVSLIAQVQFLSSEERITKIASDELGMIKAGIPKEVIIINKNKVEEISEKLKDKYDK